jgi:hypothetical protein
LSWILQPCQYPVISLLKIQPVPYLPSLPPDFGHVHTLSSLHISVPLSVRTLPPNPAKFLVYLAVVPLGYLNGHIDIQTALRSPDLKLLLSFFFVCIMLSDLLAKMYYVKKTIGFCGESRARILKLLRRPRIDSKESISPAYVAWRLSRWTDEQRKVKNLQGFPIFSSV